MVMTKVTKGAAKGHVRRVGVAEAKAKLSEVLRSIERAPIGIHSRGRDIGALIDIATFERFTAANDTDQRPGGAAFLDAVDAIKQRHGGGVADFEPAPLKIRVGDPFK